LRGRLRGRQLRLGLFDLANLANLLLAQSAQLLTELRCARSVLHSRLLPKLARP
jgi:hypothetical protein